jgi:hypothetical protein
MLSQVTHHSAIFPPSMRNTAPKSNCAFRPDGGNGPVGPCCAPSCVVHAATRFPSATRGFGQNREKPPYPAMGPGSLALVIRARGRIGWSAGSATTRRNDGLRGFRTLPHSDFEMLNSLNHPGYAR